MSCLPHALPQFHLEEHVAECDLNTTLPLSRSQSCISHMLVPLLEQQYQNRCKEMQMVLEEVTQGESSTLLCKKLKCRDQQKGAYYFKRRHFRAQIINVPAPNSVHIPVCPTVLLTMTASPISNIDWFRN